MRRRVESTRFRPDVDAPAWRGGHVPYDIIKEGTIAFVVVALLTVALAVLFGSPDEYPLSIKSWSTYHPVDFANTAVKELDGTSASALYGAPYNTASPGQKLGPFTLARWVGVRIPVHSARDFVLGPLASLPGEPVLKGDLTQYERATPATRQRWLRAYSAAPISFSNGELRDGATQAGPVPTIISSLTQMARSGALDQGLITQSGFYTTNYTLPLLFLADGSYLSSVATHQHLAGDQWGMMNETGNYPGQAWLWLYTFWYQIPPLNTSPNADVLVWAIMMVLTVLLALVPFLPFVRSLPRRTKVYRLIWREHYRNVQSIEQ